MNFRTLDLNLLRVFDVVMTEGSLTRAAQVLSMTQPAVSHAMRRLHDAIGEPLFERSAHGMRPTARARALWPQVRSALSVLQQTLAPARFEPQRDAVNLRLAMADSTAAMLLPSLVSAIEQQRALANLRVLPLATRDPRAMLERDDCELAVGYFPEAVAHIEAQGADASLRHRRLADTRYVCVMRRGHPLAAPDALDLDAYCAAGHLLVSFSGRPHGFVDQALAGLGRQRRIVLTVNQFFTAGRVVSRSDLLTVLPESFVPATGFQTELVTRELPFELGRIHIEMLWHLRRDAEPAHRWLRVLIEQAGAGERAAAAGLSAPASAA